MLCISKIIYLLGEYYMVYTTGNTYHDLFEFLLQPASTSYSGLYFSVQACDSATVVLYNDIFYTVRFVVFFLYFTVACKN